MTSPHPCSDALLDDLAVEATRFRQALERTDLSSFPSLSSFPAGCCGDVADMSGEWLTSRGFPDAQYVAGTRRDPFGTHAWVEYHDLIIDITSDQFDDVDMSVVVTRDGAWHAQYEFDGHGSGKQQAARIDRTSGPYIATLRRAYETIISNVEVAPSPKLKSPTDIRRRRD